MRIVRETGNVSLLLPEGIDHIADAPHTLHDAMVMGLRVLDWQENLDHEEDEMPPRRIWLNQEKLGDWFSNVRRKRKEKYDIRHDPAEDPDATYEDNDLGLIAHGQ